MFPIVETLDAGEVLEIAASGRYLEIVDLTGGVDIRLTTREGREVASGRSVLIGSFFNTKDQFETITITNVSGASTTIRAFYGDGQAGSRRTSGTVSISGTVTAQTELDTRTTADQVYTGFLNSASAGYFAVLPVSQNIRIQGIWLVNRDVGVQNYSLIAQSSLTGALVTSGNIFRHFSGTQASGVATLEARAGTNGGNGMMNWQVPANSSLYVDLTKHPIAAFPGSYPHIHKITATLGNVGFVCSVAP